LKLSFELVGTPACTKIINYAVKTKEMMKKISIG